MILSNPGKLAWKFTKFTIQDECAKDVGQAVKESVAFVFA